MQLRKNILLFCLAVIFAITFSNPGIFTLRMEKAKAAHKIYYVSPEGNDSNPGTTWATAIKTIQAAINQGGKPPWDLYVKEGTYLENINIALIDNGNGINIYGGFAGDETTIGARHGGATIIDGQDLGRVISTQSKVTLDGMKLENGQSEAEGGCIYSTAPWIYLQSVNIDRCQSKKDGGAIFLNPRHTVVSPNVTAILKNVTITNSSASGSGGAIYTYNVPVDFPITVINWLQSVQISNCSAYNGGGIALGLGELDLYSSQLSNNTATNSGGSVYVDRWGYLDMRNTTISSSKAYRGGGLAGQSVDQSKDMHISNSRFIGNTAGAAVIGKKLPASCQPIPVGTRVTSCDIYDEGGGAIWFRDRQAALYASGNYFYGNGASYGSAINSSQRVYVDNNIFAKNSAESATLLISAPDLSQLPDADVFINTFSDNCSTVGPSAIFIDKTLASGVKVIGNILSFNNGLKQAAVGTNSSSRDHPFGFWEENDFWQNRNGDFQGNNYGSNMTSFQDDPHFLNRTLLNNPYSFRLSHLNNLAGKVEATKIHIPWMGDARLDYSGIWRYDPADQNTEHYITIGALESTIKDNQDGNKSAIATLMEWKGPKSNGDQSYAELNLLIKNENGETLLDSTTPQSPAGEYFYPSVVSNQYYYQGFVNGGGSFSPPFEVWVSYKNYLRKHYSLASLEGADAPGAAGSIALIGGDANQDNAINSADLDIVTNNYGQLDPDGNHGDIDGNGIVDASDLSIVISNLGAIGD